MILRVVKMVVDQNKIDVFNHFMSNVKMEKIKLEGCVHYDHFGDKQYQNVFYSYTIWESERYLNKYRKSELFREVSSTLRSLCLTEPTAWTVENVFPEGDKTIRSDESKD
jgi:quinol monooxygenase YgiN